MALASATTDHIMSELPLKKFSAKVMLENIGAVKTIIQRIRQKEGGIGSDEDELSLHRLIQDLDLLVDIVDGVKARYDELDGKFSVAATSVMTLSKQNAGMKTAYEKMVHDRNERIIELEEKLKLRPKRKKTTKKTTKQTKE